ncbi:Protein HESO1 [Vitis vinifera]|uniref:Protein HESO1 n=1 Tax=Vitis vinifera TaxID=29760 RepID=A0A438JY62_VITVI|nr:Protein HESO1 [Vitis vinifera]
MKSKFLFWISGIDGRFRDLVLLVKEWARAHDINNSKTGTLNSYSLSLLVVFHLQVIINHYFCINLGNSSDQGIFLTA